MFHRIATYESACAPKACFTVHGEDARVALTHLEEFLDDSVRRCRSVNEEHVSMTDACFREFGTVVLGLVKSNNVRHSEMPEHL